jgi:hypothetical protein
LLIESLSVFHDKEKPWRQRDSFRSISLVVTYFSELQVLLAFEYSHIIF